MTDRVIDNSNLIQQLAARGTRHLRAVDRPTALTDLSDADLISELAQHPEPRFREALIALFIRRPDLATLVPRLADALDPSTSLVLRHMYTAAVCLQRFWRSTLGIYLDDCSLLNDYFGETDFGLPNVNEHFGESALRALADVFKERTGDEWLSAYHSLMALLLEQLRLEQSNDAKDG